MEYLVIFAGAALLGLVPAFIARRKGRDFATWWIYGAAVFIIALPHALLMEESLERRTGMRRCPSCSEWNSIESRTCASCGRTLPIFSP